METNNSLNIRLISVSIRNSMIRCISGTILFLTICVSCQKSEENKGNLISTDLILLSKIVDLSKYTPDSVIWEQKQIGVPENRPSAPGPKDYAINCLLYYSHSTFDQLKKEIIPSNDSSIKLMAHNWLPDSVQSIVRNHEGGIYQTDVFSKGAFKNAHLLILEEGLIFLSISTS